MEKQILRLRQQGKTYKQIMDVLGCSKSTVSYYCGKGQKEKTLQRTQKLRKSKSLCRKVDSYKNNPVGKGVPAPQSNSGASLKGRVRLFQTRKGGEKTFGYKEVLEKFEEKTHCYLTGRFIDLNSPKSYTLDHITPKSKGGGNTLENMGLACREANQAKSDLFLENFLILCEDVLRHHGYTVLPPKSINDPKTNEDVM